MKNTYRAQWGLPQSHLMDLSEQTLPKVAFILKSRWASASDFSRFLIADRLLEICEELLSFVAPTDRHRRRLLGDYASWQQTVSRHQIRIREYLGLGASARAKREAWSNSSTKSPLPRYRFPLFPRSALFRPSPRLRRLSLDLLLNGPCAPRVYSTL